MRITISLILLFSCFFAFSQRVSFEDPDLTFSFVKPKKWEVFDDGYVVKVSPSAQDSASTYFTITYFEDAQSFGLFPNAGTKNKISNSSSKIKIDGEPAKAEIKMINGSHKGSYTFMKYGQRFELKTATTQKRQNRVFRKIIRSIRITK